MMALLFWACLRVLSESCFCSPFITNMFCCEVKTIIWFTESVHGNCLKINSKCLWNFVLCIHLSGLVTAVAVFRNPNTISLCLTTDLLLNVLFSWLLVHLPSTFFLDILFFQGLVFGLRLSFLRKKNRPENIKIVYLASWLPPTF